MLVRDGPNECKTAVIVIKSSSAAVIVLGWMGNICKRLTGCKLIPYFSKMTPYLLLSYVHRRWCVPIGPPQNNTGPLHVSTFFFSHSIFPVLPLNISLSKRSSMPLCSLRRTEATDVEALTPPECNPDPCSAHSHVSTHCYIIVMCVCVCLNRSACGKKQNRETARECMFVQRHTFK